jgi:hypothetical protein
MGLLIKRRIAPRTALLQGSDAQLKIDYTGKRCSAKDQLPQGGNAQLKIDYHREAMLS